MYDFCIRVHAIALIRLCNLNDYCWFNMYALSSFGNCIYPVTASAHWFSFYQLLWEAESEEILIILVGVHVKAIERERQRERLNTFERRDEMRWDESRLRLKIVSPISSTALCTKLEVKKKYLLYVCIYELLLWLREEMLSSRLASLSECTTYYSSRQQQQQ